MVERHLVKRRRRGVASRCDRRRCGRGSPSPPSPSRSSACRLLSWRFGLPVAGISGLLLDGNRVDVRRVEAARQLVLRGAQAVGELLQQLRRALRPLAFEREFEDRLQRRRPPVVLPGAGGRAGSGGSRRTVIVFFFFQCAFHFKYQCRKIPTRRLRPGKSGRLDPKPPPEASVIATATLPQRNPNEFIRAPGEFARPGDHMGFARRNLSPRARENGRCQAQATGAPGVSDMRF